jgi:hypothetical protein
MVQVVMSATPWLVFLIMMGFFIIFFSMMFGVNTEEIKGMFWGKGWGWFIVLLVVVILFSVGGALGPGLLSAQTPGSGNQGGTPVNPDEPVFDAQGNLVPAGTINPGTSGSGTQPGTATNDFGTNLIFTLFNPKVLGLLFLFILGALTIVIINV